MSELEQRVREWLGLVEWTSIRMPALEFQRNHARMQEIEDAYSDKEFWDMVKVVAGAYRTSIK